MAPGTKAKSKTIAKDGKPELDHQDSKVSTNSTNARKTSNRRLSVFLAVVFLAGENSGAGLLALPHALKYSGFYGIFLILVVCCYAVYGGILLSLCCQNVKDSHGHHPHYSDLALHAFGKSMYLVVWGCIHVTSMGVCVAHLIVVADIITNLFKELFQWPGACHCDAIIVVALILCPLTMFGSPKDFWGVALIALGSTIAFVMLLELDFVITIFTRDNEYQQPRYNKPTLEKVLVSSSTIIYAFVGIALYPSLQRDVRERQRFPFAIIYAYCLIFFISLPMAVLGFFAYGDDVEQDITKNISNGKIKMTASFLMIFYLFGTFLMHFNHSTLEIENLLSIPYGRMTFRRVLWRSLLIFSTLLLTLLVPNFGSVIHFIGGSVGTLITFIFPPLFYLKIVESVNYFHKVFLIKTFILGVMVAVLCTYLNVMGILSSLGDHSATGPCLTFRGLDNCK